MRCLSLKLTYAISYIQPHLKKKTSVTEQLVFMSDQAQHSAPIGVTAVSHAMHQGRTTMHHCSFSSEIKTGGKVKAPFPLTKANSANLCSHFEAKKK